MLVESITRIKFWGFAQWKSDIRRIVAHSTNNDMAQCMSFGSTLPENWILLLLFQKGSYIVSVLHSFQIWQVFVSFNHQYEF